MPQLDGSFSLGRYNDVARAKYPDVKSLRKRIPEMTAHNVRFMEVCPAIVSGTNNISFAKRIDPRAEELHYVVSDRLGVPRAVTQDQVGEKVVELLSNPAVKTGHTEFFNQTQDVLTPLEQWYSTDEVYAHTLEMVDTSGGTRLGIGRAIASLEQTQRSKESDMIDSIEVAADGTTVGRLRVMPEHAKGHFEGVLPRILPGHKQIRAAMQMLGRTHVNLGPDARLVGFESANFYSPVLADGQTELAITHAENPNGGFDVTITDPKKDRVVSQIKGMKARPGNGEEQALLEDQIIEGAAQSAGVTALDNLDGRLMPVLRSIGRVDLRPASSSVKPGEGVEYIANTQNTGNNRDVEGTVSIASEGKFIGFVYGIKASLVPPEVISRILQ
jgi:hypothetical protein